MVRSFKAAHRHRRNRCLPRRSRGRAPASKCPAWDVPLRGEPRAERRISRLPGKRCHRPHRFSRQEQWRRYRNLIKIQPLSSLRTQGPIATEASFTKVPSRSALSRQQRGMGPCVRRDDRDHAYEIPISSRSASSRFQMGFWPPWTCGCSDSRATS